MSTHWRWDHAVLRVTPLAGPPPTYLAIAHAGELEIYRETSLIPTAAKVLDEYVISPCHWARALADLGADGWELVTAVYATNPGRGPYPNATADFFLKRPATF